MKTRRSAFFWAKELIDRQKSRLALLIGNGVNLASGRTAGGISWDELMISLIDRAAADSPNALKNRKRLKRLLRRGKNGQTPASLPEVFDIIEATARPRRLPLENMIVERLRKMRPGRLHRAIANWALESEVPLLTTNYDHCFEDALKKDESKKRSFGLARHSDYYPWDRYYSPHKITDPASEFGIWHIHGDQDLKRSIRAGLDQYMGMVEKLRKLKWPIAKAIFRAPDEQQTKQPIFHSAPWLHIFMRQKLWIQGLGLSPAEVSIRWLLIQRFRYWRRYNPNHRPCSGWYIHGPTVDVDSLDDERRYFFESVGLQVIEIQERDDMYLNLYSAAN